MKDDYHINVSLVRDFFQPSWRLRTHPLTLNPSVWMTISMFFPFSGRHWHIYFTFLSMFWSVMQNILHSATQTLARIWQSSEDPFRMLLWATVLFTADLCYQQCVGWLQLPQACTVMLLYQAGSWVMRTLGSMHTEGFFWAWGSRLLWTS